MNKLRSLLIYLATMLIPLLGIVLITQGSLRLSLAALLVVSWTIIFLFAEKIILVSFGAREIIDADSQELFQVIKSLTYQFHEKTPRVYLYSGHRLKCFVLDRLNDWTILLDRNLVAKLDNEQTQALVEYIIAYKKSGVGKVQTVGMGTLSLILKTIYSFWSIFNFRIFSKLYKVGIFITLILAKPLIELVLLLSKGTQKVTCPISLKSIHYQIELEITKRTFSEFMVYHLDKDFIFSNLVVEFLEGYPMLENCQFEETI